MKIRGIILSSLLLTTALSCGKDDLSVSDSPSAPRTLISLTGRGGGTRYAEQAKSDMVVPGSVIPKEYTIMTSAYFVNETAPEKSGDYLTLEPFTYQNDSTWNATPQAYWPLGGNLSFLCLATIPDSLDLRYCTEFSKGNVSRGVLVDVPDDSLLGSELLFANATTRHAEDGIVNLTFEHSQCWVQLDMFSNEAGHVRIDSVTVHETLTGGKFDIENNAFIHGDWDFSNHYAHDIVIPDSRRIVLSPTEASCSVLLPEQGECDIIIDYSVRSDLSTPWSMATRRSHTIAKTDDKWWLGYKYIYKVEATMTTLITNFIVNDWNYSSSHDYEI